jgi:4-diphosphocytidyl-2-C-methyl-D-erythritol kinase
LKDEISTVNGLPGRESVNTYRAYAKINLGLFVLRKRPDGFHDIETVFHRINLYDEITLAPADEIIVEEASSLLETDVRNTCYQAAALLQRETGVTTGARITIRKNIPVGAGLGGGSSDAASVLMHLPTLWNVQVSENGLLSIAQRIGSDVPYFLRPGSARATGRGEILEYFHLDLPFTILVCYPNIHVSTAWAYQHVTPLARSNNLRTILTAARWDARTLAESLINDFEEAVFPHHPEIEEVKQQMLDHGARFSLMSGSGSSVYGFFDDPERAQQVRRSLTTRHLSVFETEPHFKPTG